MDSGAPANNMLEGKGSENGKEILRENEMSCEAQISEMDPSISSVMNSIVSQVESDTMSSPATTCVVEETKFSDDKSGCQLTLRFSNGGDSKEDDSSDIVIIEELPCPPLSNQSTTEVVAKLKYDTQLSPGGVANSIGCEKIGNDDNSAAIQQVAVNSNNTLSAEQDEKAGSSKKPTAVAIFLPGNSDKKKAKKTAGDAGTSTKTKAPSIKASLNICKIQNTLKALQSIPLSSSPVPSPRSNSSSSFLDQDSCSPRPYMCSSNDSESCYYPEAAIVVNSNSSPATADDSVVLIEEKDNNPSSNDSKSPGLILESIVPPAIAALDEETQSSDSLFLVNGESNSTNKEESSTTTPILSTLNCVDVLNSDSMPFPEDKIVESSDGIPKAAATITDEETQSLPGAIKEDPLVGVPPIVETLDTSLNMSIGPPDKTLLEWKDDACLLQGLIDEDEPNRLASNMPSTSSGANTYVLSNTGGFDTTSTSLPMSTDPIVVAATNTLSSSDFIVNHNNNNIDGKTETIPELSLPVSLLINSESSTSSSTSKVVVEGETNLRQPPHSPTKVVPSARSALKRRSDSTDLEECLQPKRKRRGIQFDGVTVYYFPRAQGFTCVPSQVKKHNLLSNRIMIMILLIVQGTYFVVLW